MTSLAYMLKDFGYGCSQRIKVPFGHRTLSWICILMFVLVWLNNIDIGLNIRRLV
jgi:hypothetical protein